MTPLRLMIARYPFGRHEDPDVCDWVTTTVITARHDPRIVEIIRWRKDDTPITCSRNACFEAAKQHQADFLLMVDSDMSPDALLPANPYHHPPADPDARPFFDTSLEFLWQQRKAGIPSVIGAPYCGPPPFENVYVFRWATIANNLPDEADMRLEQYSREEAACMRGIQECAALPTGLILFDCDCLEAIEPPYTYYEYRDNTESARSSTEDVVLTRDLGLAGVPQFCNWDAWAGHWKHKCVTKPHLLTTEMVGQKFRNQLRREMGLPHEEEIIPLRPGEGFIAHAQAPARYIAGLCGAEDPGDAAPGSPGGEHAAGPTGPPAV